MWTQSTGMTEDYGCNLPVVLAFLNSYTEGTSGGDVWFVEVARRLTQFKWIIVTSELGRKYYSGMGLNAEFIITSQETEFRNVVLTYVLRTYRAIRLTSSINAVVVEAASDAPSDVLPALWYRWHRRKSHVTWVQRIFHLVPFRRSRMFAWAVQLVCHVFIAFRADKIVVDNSQLKFALTNRGISQERIIVSRPGFTMKRNLSTASTESSEIITQIDGLYVGRLQQSKGVFDLPEIWQRVVRLNPGAQLTIAGYGPAHVVRRLNERIVSLGLERNVALLGFVSDDALSSLRSRTRVFILPSHEEGFGMAILDAIQAGIPVVAWDLGVFREHFGNGLEVVPEGNIELFALRTAQLLNDSDRHQKLVQLGKQVAAKFDWDFTAQLELEKVFGGSR